MKIKQTNPDFHFKKNLGQNFLSDTNLLMALVKDAKVTSEEQVLEIGAGAGTFTKVLAATAKRVVSYEIDLSLKEHLLNEFKNINNVTFIFKDILKADIKEIEVNFDKKFSLIANIPYYITAPIIFKFLKQSEKIEKMALMMQKEVALKICAKEGDSNYGALSVICQYHNNCKILRVISKKMFKPVPKVDSAFIKLEKTKNYDEDFSELVKNAFAMRRKTLVNNLQKKYPLDKNQLAEIFSILNLDINTRPENLSVLMFEKLSLQIKSLLYK